MQLVGNMACVMGKKNCMQHFWYKTSNRKFQYGYPGVQEDIRNMLSDLKYQMSSSVVFQFMVELPNQLNICETEGGAQNVIPLTVHITHFYCYKSI